MAKPDKKPTPSPPPPPPEPVERPDFIPEGASVVTILTICDDLRKAARVEQSIQTRLVIYDRDIYDRRINALNQMVQEGMKYARYLREIERAPPARFGGFGVGDRVRITDTGGMEGEIIGLQPLYEPSHLLVWLDSGKQCCYLPERLILITDN